MGCVLAGKFTHISDSSFCLYVDISAFYLCFVTSLVGLSAGQELVAITWTHRENPLAHVYESQYIM